jgi:predicted methyltransferase
VETLPPTLPLLTLRVARQLLEARSRGETRLTCSLDLGKSTTLVEPGATDWGWHRDRFPYPEKLRDRTIYGWTGSTFDAVSRYAGGLVKLVPTDWGPPTFEIDGIKMLVTAKRSPFEDARQKVELIAPRGKRILDCCAGLGYFAHWCMTLQAAEVQSYEINASVLWLRTVNPWSPRADPRLRLIQADIAERIETLAAASVDAILHDPPRFGTAGALYSQRFYDQLARVIVKGGLLFHYTGQPNRITSGRDVPNEVRRRLEKAGFVTRIEGDGLVAQRAARRARPGTRR